jgi:hypothetical protein
MMLGSDATQRTFSSTWTWPALIALVALGISTYFSIEQMRKRNRAKEAQRYQPDYALLDETVVELEKLFGIAARKTDATRLYELLSRIKQAERRFPSLPFGTVVAYKKTTLSDDFTRKLTTTKLSTDTLLDLSRQQGAKITAALAAIATVQAEIDRRTT